MSDIVIGTIPKTSKERVAVQLCEFKGKRRLDIRTQVRNDEQDWINTKRGVSLPIELAEPLLELVKKAVAEIVK